MRASTVQSFQHTAASCLKRPWQTFRDGQPIYGLTKRGSKRHPLTGKQGNKHFYKGTGSSGYGKLNADGIYIMDWTKVRTYVVPAGLNSSDLKALVSPKVPQVLQTFEGYQDGFKDPQLAWQSIKEFIEFGENYNDRDLEKMLFLEEYVHPDIVAAEQEQNTVQ
ncbi:large subunit ribosomal protein L41 [Metschnikowia aff. pulcherrima]|uniref:Large subunit ribosomal protein L41 n=1 Tax=Metschnikowia aff. pulcherrima TaxID=2163413 RepID=A0A4P6XT58_9ASCO|nr:large subunit ribosomal protein L41 [Metschnikowia aff. pulcherrima]